MDLTSPEIREKVEEYANFLKTVLRPKFTAAQQAENIVRREMAEYEDLRSRLKGLLDLKCEAKEQTMQVDLGHDKVFCEASFIVDDTTKVFVDVGMGLHVELTVNEALKFTEKKLQFLKNQKLANQTDKVRQIQNHVRQSEMILDELSHELQRAARRF